MSAVIPQERLDMAAIALHRVLEQNSFDHTFFGGYQLQLMGQNRGTKDVDVVVKKPMFNGFEKVKRVFVDDPEFMVFDGNRTDGIRAIHSPSSVGVDIMLQWVTLMSLSELCYSLRAWMKTETLPKERLVYLPILTSCHSSHWQLHTCSSKRSNVYLHGTRKPMKRILYSSLKTMYLIRKR